MISNLEKKLEKYIGKVKNKLWHRNKKKENITLEIRVI